jgi:hypothetical protein
MKTIFIIMTAVLVLFVATAADGSYKPDKETSAFLKAKEEVFDRDWEGAIRQMESYLDQYPKGRFEEEARYWMARSLNQMSRDAKQAGDVIRLKEQAIQSVDVLLEKYPESIWKDDALTLRMETAAQLALLGDEEYQHYIQKIVTEQHKTETELTKIALEALVQFGPEIALPLIESVLNEQTNPELRRTAVTLVGQVHGKEALPLLRHLETEDADPEVRELAAYWRKKTEMQAIPVVLHYYGYAAVLEKESDLRRVLEDKLNVFEIPAPKSSDAKDVEKAIKKFFDSKLPGLQWAANATLGLELESELAAYGISTQVSHNLADFRVSVPSESIKKSYFNISGNASFFDKYTDREYAQDFVVDANKTLLMVMRHGEEVALLVLMFESTEELVQEDDEPVYYTQINNVFGSMVHSSRQSWDMKDLDAAVVEYGRARAEIPGDTGTWVLIGHIQMHRATKLFVARDARLYNPKGEVVAEGSEIVVPAKAPEQFEVKDKGR